MTDKGDLDFNIFLGLSKDKQVLPGDIPFRFHGGYSKKELETLKNFMHSDFDHVAYGGGRNREVLIEYPPENICSNSEWKDILDTVFVPEWKNFDPKLLRHHKIVVRFVERLYDKKLDLSSGGNGTVQQNEEWFRIPTKDADGTTVSIENLTFILMHELAETDFWSKTLQNDDKAFVKKQDEINSFKSEDDEYRNLLDEKIANRRALRAINRMWPLAQWSEEKYVYEEDK